MTIMIDCDSKEIADLLTLAVPKKQLIEQCTNKVCNEISKVFQGVLVPKAYSFNFDSSDFESFVKNQHIQTINEVLKSAPTSLKSALDFVKINDFFNDILYLTCDKTFIEIITPEVTKHLEDFLSQKLGRKISTQIIFVDN